VFYWPIWDNQNIKVSNSRNITADSLLKLCKSVTVPTIMEMDGDKKEKFISRRIANHNADMM
jgi:hypothetical protein